MSDLHIEEFYRDAARIVVSLFGVFPRPVPIYAEDICGPDEPDEYGLHGVRYQSCFATLLWLAEEGYIRYADVIRQDAVDQAVLTGRCFSALLKPVHPPVDPEAPASVQAQQTTVVYRLQQAVRERDSAAISAAFQPLLTSMTD